MIPVYILLGAGFVFHTIGTIALHRFPDPYTRMHGATKCTTLGSILTYLAIIYFGIALFLSGSAEYAALSIHTVFVMVLIMITNPTSAHAIARAAHRSGIKPEDAVVDKLKEKES